MHSVLRSTFRPIEVASRNAAALLISGVARRFGVDDVRDRIEARPPREQAVIVGGTLGFLFLLSLLAAQFGWVGMLIFFLAVIVVAR